MNTLRIHTTKSRDSTLPTTSFTLVLMVANAAIWLYNLALLCK